MQQKKSGPVVWQRSRLWGLSVVGLFTLCSSLAQAAVMDVCGCAGNPNSLGDFRSSDPTTYPPGTTVSNYSSYLRYIVLPVPADGRMVFNSMIIDKSPDNRRISLSFKRNPGNTKVTLLVAGDFTLASAPDGGMSEVILNGANGLSGTQGINGLGGNGGPGGFRGGDGAYQLVNFQGDGGAGLGPAGGNGGTLTPLLAAQYGGFVGIPELLPMVGGSGGGGGYSKNNSLGCAGGGGGGGGGALLLAVNGTLTIQGNIMADGGWGGGGGNGCASDGAPGSGGAIRLLASAIVGSGNVYARSRGGYWRRDHSKDGRIRLEAFSNSLPGDHSEPVASRTPAPGPLVQPVSPTVAITAVQGMTISQVNGALLADLPQGIYGKTDVLLPAPGPVTVDLSTHHVPSGTTVAVRFKPNPGGLPISSPALLDPLNCDATDNCTGQVTVDLAAGRYMIEAEATFQVP